MAFIYLVLNKINGKPYVGATITQINERWNRHVHCALTEQTGQALHAAIRKYGTENFEVYPIIEHSDKEFVFNTLEPYFIEFFHAHGSKGGYNMTTGGDGWLGMKHSQETKDKISKANTGKKRSDEVKRKLSESQKGKKAWNKGLECPQISQSKKNKTFGEEIRKIWSDSHKGLKQSKETKNKIGNTLAEQHKIKLPDNKEIEISNLRQFCRENRLSVGSLTTYKETKGYKLLYSIKKERTYTILNETTNETFTTNNLKKFCEEHGNISNAGLLGKYKLGKSYTNWKIINIEIKEVKYTYNSV